MEQSTWALLWSGAQQDGQNADHTKDKQHQCLVKESIMLMDQDRVQNKGVNKESRRIHIYGLFPLHRLHVTKMHELKKKDERVQ